MTGLPSALRQPLRFQPAIHLVTQLITYWLSQSTCSSSSRCSVARNSSSTAFSSAWLFVACGHPPAAQRSSSTYHAQPAGPGFPRAEPSAAAVITVSFRGRIWCGAHRIGRSRPEAYPWPADDARTARPARRRPRVDSYGDPAGLEHGAFARLHDRRRPRRGPAERRFLGSRGHRRAPPRRPAPAPRRGRAAARPARGHRDESRGGVGARLDRAVPRRRRDPRVPGLGDPAARAAESLGRDGRSPAARPAPHARVGRGRLAASARRRRLGAGRVAAARRQPRRARPDRARGRRPRLRPRRARRAASSTSPTRASTWSRVAASSRCAAASSTCSRPTPTTPCGWSSSATRSRSCGRSRSPTSGRCPNRSSGCSSRPAANCC